MGVGYVHVYRSGNMTKQSWLGMTFDNEVSDADALFASPYFTAPSDGNLIHQINTRALVAMDQRGAGVLIRHYIDDVLIGKTNRYNGSSQKESATDSNQTKTLVSDIPMLSGETHKFDLWSNDLYTVTLEGGQEFNARYIFLPDGEAPSVEMYGKSANQGPYTQGAAYVQLTDFDRVIYGAGDWVEVGDDEFKMPSDGFLWATMRQGAVVNVTRQHWWIGGRIYVNGSTVAEVDEGGTSMGRTGSGSWGVQFDYPFTPVSKDDIVKFEWRVRGFGSDAYELEGFDTNSNDECVLTLRLFT